MREPGDKVLQPLLVQSYGSGIREELAGSRERPTVLLVVHAAVPRAWRWFWLGAEQVERLLGAQKFAFCILNFNFCNSAENEVWRHEIRQVRTGCLVPVAKYIKVGVRIRTYTPFQQKAGTFFCGRSHVLEPSRPRCT